MIDFGALPPEIISGLMYSGPGAESMLSAAAAWDALSAELRASARSYAAAVAQLTDEFWAGPSAARMAVGIAPLIGWLSGAATQAKMAGAQAVAGSAAYETAFAGTVPPPVIAANRAQMAQLLMTNILGQNSAAIANTEAQYAQMWAEDAAAMQAYAASAATATRLAEPPSPRQVTNPVGQATQETATGWAIGDGAGSGPLAAIPHLLNNLGLGGSGVPSSGAQVPVLGPLYGDAIDAGFSALQFEGISNAVMSVPNFGMVEFKTFFQPLALLPDIPKAALGAGLGTVGATSPGVASSATSSVPVGTVRAVTAMQGEAPAVGALSVPQGWATATPAIRLAATGAAQVAQASAAAAPGTNVACDLVNPAALGSLTGGALGAPGTRLINGGAGGARAGKNRAAPVQLDRVIVQLQKKRDSVQHWQVEEADLDDLLAELSKKPGFHAVHLTKSGGKTAKVTEPAWVPTRDNPMIERE